MAMKQGPIPKIEDAARARAVAEMLMEQIREAINETHAGIGFVLGMVGPPSDMGDGQLSQEFFFTTNANEVGSIVGLLGRCMEQVARAESRKRIIDPNEGGLPQ